MNIFFNVRNWPSRWCGLRPIDYFLWGYVKPPPYADKPASIGALEDNIEAFIREIPAEMLERVCRNWTKRIEHLRRSRSQHLHEIIFKYQIIWTILSIQIKILCIFIKNFFFKITPYNTALHGFCK